MRDKGWNNLFDDIIVLCNKHKIEVPSTDDMYVLRGRYRRNFEKVTNMHHYLVQVFHPMK